MNPIPLIVDVDALETGSWPVTTGIPFPDDLDTGGLTGNENLSVCWDGAPIATQTRVTSRWPSGLVRWLLVDFQVDAGADTELYTLEQKEPVDPHGLVLTVEHKGDIRIKTSTQLAYVPTQGPLELRLMEPGGGPEWMVPAIGGPIGFVLEHANTEFRAYLDPGDEAVVVEESGLTRTTLRTRGWFEAEDGQRFCRFEIRFSFYAGLSLFRIEHTLIYVDSSAMRDISSLALEIPVQPGLSRAFGNNADDPSTSTPDAISLRRLLDSWRRPSVVVDNLTQSAEPASNWCAVGGSSGSGIAVALRDAWQNAPNGVRFEDDRLYVELWPANDDPLDHKPRSVIDRYYGGPSTATAISEWYCGHFPLPHPAQPDPTGLAKTHELWLRAWMNENKITAGEQLGHQADHPVFALASTQHNCDSMALGHLHPYDDSQFGDTEKAIEALFDGFLRQRAQWKIHGWLLYGDVHTLAGAQTRLGLDARGAFLYQLEEAWEASHYGFPMIPWILFYRSGDRKYLEFAEANTRHVMDVDRCHHGELPPLDPAGKLLSNGAFTTDMCLDRVRRFKGCHFGDEGTIFPGDGRPFVSNYQVLEFLPYPFYLRGEPRGVSVLADWYAAVAHFHDLEVGYATEHFLRLIIRAGDGTSEKVLKNLRHIAAPLGNLVEYGRTVLLGQSALLDAEKEAWAGFVADYCEAVISMASEGIDDDLEFRINQNLRHAWSGLTNAARLFADLGASADAEHFNDALDLGSNLRDEMFALAYRAAVSPWMEQNASFEDVTYGYEYAMDKGGSAYEKKAKDLLDLGLARLGALISRVNTLELDPAWKNYMEVWEDPQSDLPWQGNDTVSWQTAYGPRGSSGEDTIPQTYYLRSLPGFLGVLHAALEHTSPQLPSDPSWFRLVGPKMPTLRVTVTAANYLLKLHLGSYGTGPGLANEISQTGTLSFDSETCTVKHVQDAEYGSGLVEISPEFFDDCPNIPVAPTAGHDFEIAFDHVSIFKDDTDPHQLAFVDTLRVEGLDISIPHETVAKEEWNDLVVDSDLALGPGESKEVFRVFGRRFWFKIPDDTKRVEVSVYVGYQMGNRAYDPVLNLYDETGERPAPPSSPSDSFTAHQTGTVDEMRQLLVSAEVDDNSYNRYWSFGPIGHARDPYRSNAQRTAESNADVGFRTWATVYFELNDGTRSPASALFPIRPQGAPIESALGY